MSYNKAKEQKKWEEWKEKEENILRSENFEENKITILREYDWKSFKEERCYRTNEHITKDVFFEMSKSTELERSLQKQFIIGSKDFKKS